MTSSEVKDRVRDTIELGFDKLHRVADVVTFPLAPLDGAVHGFARGILNWVTDTHPQKQANRKPANGSPQPAYPEPTPGGIDGRPPPPSRYPSGYSGYQSAYYGNDTHGNSGEQKIDNVTNGANTVKVGNFGGA